MKLQGSVMPKAFIFALPSALIAVGLHFLYGYTGVKPQSLEKAATIWASFTFILGVLTVFRTNQAYSRYWEGATLLLQVRGEWLNACSSLFAFCSAEECQRDAVIRFQHQMVRLMSMLYCAALQNVALVGDDSMEIIDMEGLDPKSVRFLIQSEERCDVLLQWIRRLVVQGMSRGVIPVPPPILTRVFQELSRGIVNAKDVQKIAEFPFPFPYTQMIVIMLVVQSFVTPLMISISGADPISAFLVTFVVVLSLWCMNYIAGELEQPFGEDFNDLPIPQMMADMNDRLKALMQPEAQAPPHFSFYHGMEECRVISCAASGYSSSRTVPPGFAKSRSLVDFSKCSSDLTSVSSRSRRPSAAESHRRPSVDTCMPTMLVAASEVSGVFQAHADTSPRLGPARNVAFRDEHRHHTAPIIRAPASAASLPSARGMHTDGAYSHGNGSMHDLPTVLQSEMRSDSKSETTARGDNWHSFAGAEHVFDVERGELPASRSSSRSRADPPQAGGSLTSPRRILPAIPSMGPYISDSKGGEGFIYDAPPRRSERRESRSWSHDRAGGSVILRLPQDILFRSAEDPFAGPPITGAPSVFSPEAELHDHLQYHHYHNHHHHAQTRGSDALPSEGDVMPDLEPTKPALVNLRGWQDDSKVSLQVVSEYDEAAALGKSPSVADCSAAGAGSPASTRQDLASVATEELTHQVVAM